MSFSIHLEDWRGWIAAEATPTPDPRHRISAQPGNDLPAMLRRRLDSAGRATCEILAALDPGSDFPLVHASRHGDTTRSLAMLEALQRGEPISPTHFSMSVHNALLGVHSIARQHHRPIQALGACGDEFDAILEEAKGYLVEGYQAIIAVFSECVLASAYHGCTEHPGIPCAVGLRLTLNTGQALLSSDPAHPTHPTPLEVISWLNGDSPYLEGRRRWELGTT